MNVYLLPGMGADERLFSRLETGDHPQHPVRWVQPGKGDSLADYAEKLLPQLADPFQAALLGVSMGGMIAVELGKLASFRKVIIISSAKTAGEIPPYIRKLRTAGWRKKIEPEQLISLRHIIAPVMNLFGSGYKVFDEMIKDTDPRFLDWSIEAVLNWDNQTVPPNVTHIHGTADLLLPARYISGYIPVRNGSHLMVYQKAGEINKLIKRELTLC